MSEAGPSSGVKVEDEAEAVADEFMDLDTPAEGAEDAAADDDEEEELPPSEAPGSPSKITAEQQQKMDEAAAVNLISKLTHKYILCAEIGNTLNLINLR